MYTAMYWQAAVTAYFSSEQLLLFAFKVLISSVVQIKNNNKFFYSAHTVLCALYTQLKVGVTKNMLL